ncbi:type II toxin-antitoxin system VapC family toxin [Nocardioides humilatus]|uniref:type II toxin-antitoxin system VapC family toxin n=1 Tax=Nocardioides humilatus TaxID=2607660 RepID=UPI00165F86C4|nr:type II toxin-antitoxin system VapC family toxin [Nocardioides humilatus]
MILVDTNVWSETTKRSPDPAVLAWLVAHRDQLALCSITVGELLNGVELMTAGRRRDELTASVERLISNGRGRTYPYDEPAARAYAGIVTRRRSAGRPFAKPEDAMIAAIAIANECSVATRNVGDFAEMGVELINPWETAQP